MYTNITGNSLSLASFIICVLILHYFLPSVLHSAGRTGAAGSQETRGRLVGISGRLSGDGCSGRGERWSRRRGQRSEELRLLETDHSALAHAAAKDTDPPSS